MHLRKYPNTSIGSWKYGVFFSFSLSCLLVWKFRLKTNYASVFCLWLYEKKKLCFCSDFQMLLLFYMAKRFVLWTLLYFAEITAYTYSYRVTVPLTDSARIRANYKPGYRHKGTNYYLLIRWFIIVFSLPYSAAMLCLARGLNNL